MYVVKRWKDCNKVRLRYNCLILAIAVCWYVLLYVQEILFKLNKISWTYSIFQISSFKWRILPMWPYNYALYRMSNNSSSTFIVSSLYENGQDFWTYSMTFPAVILFSFIPFRVHLPNYLLSHLRYVH